jgi:hypothetical protein
MFLSSFLNGNRMRALTYKTPKERPRFPWGPGLFFHTAALAAYLDLIEDVNRTLA